MINCRVQFYVVIKRNKIITMYTDSNAWMRFVVCFVVAYVATIGVWLQYGIAPGVSLS